MSRTKTLPRTNPSKRRSRRGAKTPSKALPHVGPIFAGPVLAGMRLNALLSLLLAIVTLALYSPVLGHRFVLWDDGVYVTGNPHIRGGLSWSTIRWAFTATAAANWHPVTWLSHAFDYQVFALNPAGHHFVSIVIHALNAVVLFLVLAWITRRVGASFFVAALFALHPLNVESVAWIAERKNVLSTFFFLLAIAAYAWYAQKKDWRRYLLTVTFFAIGLMAKPMVITLPFVLLLLDYWPLNRTTSSPPSPIGAPQLSVPKLLLEKIPLLILSAASGRITLLAQRSGNAVRNLHEFPFAIRAANAVVSYSLYLWKMLWPARLAALYPHPSVLPAWQVLLSAFILFAITTLVLVFHRQRYLLVGWFWFLGTLVPVVGLVQVGEQAMADRYAYIPLIGIFIMIAWSFDDWAEARRLRAPWRVIPASCGLILLASVTLRQMSYWESEYTLWAHTAQVTNQNPYAHAELGAALLKPEFAMTAIDLEGLGPEERLAEARSQYEQALSLYRQLMQRYPETYLPDLAATLSNLGDVARLQNQPEEARRRYEESVQDYRMLVQQNPSPHLTNMVTSLSNLANIDWRLNHLDEAHSHYEEALQIYRQLERQNLGAEQPKIVDTLISLGQLAKAQKQPDKAFPYFEEALDIGRRLAQQDPAIYLPSLAGRLVNFGNFDAEQERLDDARQHYEEAIKIYRQLVLQDANSFLPQLANALNNLGFVDRLQRRIVESRAHYQEALGLFLSIAQNDKRYAGNVTRIEASLRELDAKGSLAGKADEIIGTRSPSKDAGSRPEN
jgi:protein O-mannosyl-transferase